MRKKIVIAGGSGFLGSSIIEAFQKEEAEIIVLTRKLMPSSSSLKYVQWDAENSGEWISHLEKAALVINLVGRSVNCKYTKKNKKAIIDSRVNATLAIGRAIQQCVYPPDLWINAGSAAIFGDTQGITKDEYSSTGDGFSAQVCKEWEKAFHEVSTPQTRKIFFRIGIVFQKGKGLLQPFLNMVRFGMGGTIGSGEQYISWIHEEDFIAVIFWVMQKKDMQGVLHVCSPFPVKNKEFMSQLSSASGAYIALPNPAFLIHLGAFLISTEPELVLTGRRVVSKVLEEKGFVFRYPRIQEAISQLLS